MQPIGGEIMYFGSFCFNLVRTTGTSDVSVESIVKVLKDHLGLLDHLLE